MGSGFREAFTNRAQGIIKKTYMINILHSRKTVFRANPKMELKFIYSIKFLDPAIIVQWGLMVVPSIENVMISTLREK